MTQTFEESVHAIAAEWEAAWNAHDMIRLAALFTDDADLVTVAATHLKGRAEIERTHAAMHKTQFQASVWKNEKVELQSVKPDLTVVHLAWSVHGDFDPDGTPREPRSGLFTWILVQQRGIWRIRAAQNTNAASVRRSSAA